MNTRSLFSWRALRRAGITLTAGLTLGAAWIASAANLGDQPVFVTNGVPGNLALALSVEYPTAIRTAHTDAYSNTATFLGYFDPGKCYTYFSNTALDSTGQGDLSFFRPVAKTTNGYRCQGQWSGNFLNWAATATIDPFRWAMTGGRRILDTAADTIIQKGWNSGQGGLFPDRSITLSEVPLVTPYSNAIAGFNIQVNGQGFDMRIAAVGPVLAARYYNNRLFIGPVAASVSNDSGDHLWGGVSPVAGVSATNFSARFNSTFTAPSTGNYYFATNSDDTIRLFINGTEVITNVFDHAPTYNYSNAIQLTAGAQITLQADYTQAGGDSAFQLFWYKPGDSGYSIFTAGNGTADYTMSTKVCDASLGTDYLESNCQRYGTSGNYTYKPEGLIQQYSQQMRFSAFGYLNDSSDQRDGGVMRAAQKFVGPTAPVPGQIAVTNTEKEWDPATGMQIANPNPADAATTTTAVNNAVTISNSGVINYLNKFGQLRPGNYKGIDPVSEMYYAVLRYYKNLGNIASWSNMGTTDAGTIATYLDGFPVITNWTDGTTARPNPDPIQYSCQRNYILGIGDIYTHVDKNLPGNTQYRTREPAAPDWGRGETVNVVTATNKVGNLQGVGNIGSTNDYSGRNNSAYIAGLAYDANTVDIRPDDTTVSKTIGRQTVQTYWVDVLEASFQANNQFYLAAKFGGLKVPDGFDPYNFTGNIPQTWWSTSGDTLTDVRTNTTQPRPDNYFTAGRPDLMVAGLRTAFASIAAGIKNAFTSALSLSTPLVSSTGTASYSAQYNAAAWSGTVTGNTLTFAADGTPSSTVQWSSDTTLTAQAAGTGWDTGRRIASWSGTAGVPFRTTTPGLTDAQENTLQTTYVATGVDDRANYLNYLRGDRTNEKTDTDATKPYRKRTQLLGDIVDAKLTTVGAPSLSYSNSVNPGYSAFKTQKASRPTMVYAAANDGMLHAFNAATTTTGNAGTEQFAYVPSALFSGPSTPATPAVNGLAQLGNPNYVHRYYVNATPLVFDIDFANIGPFATATPPATTPTPNWRSVLIGGLGKGGKSFYALDVTDPGTISSETILATKVLWEFSDADMGYSYGAPVVVKTKKYGWVVVLTSGYTDSSANTPGYLYFLNPATGALLEKVSTGTGTVSHGLAQASAYIQDFTDNTADAIYVGDLDGQLWRFDVTAARASTGNYPAPAKLATATDASGTAQPITTQPLIEISPSTKKRYVMFGTGRLLDASDLGTSGGQSFYAIIDGTTPAFATAPATPYTRSSLTAVTDLTVGVPLSSTSPGWYTDLGSVNGIGLRVLLNPTAYNGTVAFSSLQTNADACNPNGTSRLYAIDFATGKTQLDSGAAYTQYSSAIVDTKFVQVDGKVRLVTTDATGVRKQEPLKPPTTTPLRLTNWREIPTVD